MSKKSTPDAAVTARKKQNAAANADRQATNRKAMGLYGVEPRESSRVKTLTARDGKTRDVIVTRSVRPSKLIRAARRELERTAAARAARAATAAIHAASAHSPE